MKLATQLLIAVHVALALVVFFQAVRDQLIFSLRPVLMVSLLMYITIPIVLCLPHHAVLINGALVPVDPWALTWAALAGMTLALMILLIPNPRLLQVDPAEPQKWVAVLFALLAVVNTWTLVSFLRVFDVDMAVTALITGMGSRIRDLAYDTLLEADSGLGYVTKVLSLALFGWLWLHSPIAKRWLLLGAMPVVALDVISLGRHTVASFVVVLFFVIERSRSRAMLYVIAPTVVGLIFFFRIIIFSFTDVRYDEWGASAFTASSDGVEALGEFFNTFGTYLMISSLPAAHFSWDEILSMAASQGVLPPGTGGLWQYLTGTGFPLFRISDLMKARFGPHPAHLSIADIYTFGLVSVVGLFGYLATARWAARGRNIEAGIVYVYLIAMFYLPYRGSLTLNAIRFIWLILALHLIGTFGRFLQRTWHSRPQKSDPSGSIAS